MGAESVRAAPDAAGGDHRQHGDRRLAAKPPQRADVSDLPRYAQEYDDYKRMPPQVCGFSHFSAARRFVTRCGAFVPLSKCRFENESDLLKIYE